MQEIYVASILQVKIMKLYENLFLQSKHSIDKTFSTHNNKLDNYQLDMPSIIFENIIDRGHKYDMVIKYYGLRECYANRRLIDFLTYCEYILFAYRNALSPINRAVNRVIGVYKGDIKDISGILSSFDIVYSYKAATGITMDEDEGKIYTLIYYMYMYSRYVFNSGYNEKHSNFVNHMFYDLVLRNVDLNDPKVYKSFFKSIKYKVYYKHKMNSFIKYMEEIFIPSFVNLYYK